MGADRKSTAPPFTIGGTTFQCWITDDGQRYEWRSADGRLTVGRNTGRSSCWGRRGGNLVGSSYPSLKAAMDGITGRG